MAKSLAELPELHDDYGTEPEFTALDGCYLWRDKPPPDIVVRQETMQEAYHRLVDPASESGAPRVPRWLMLLARRLCRDLNLKLVVRGVVLIEGERDAAPRKDWLDLALKTDERPAFLFRPEAATTDEPSAPDRLHATAETAAGKRRDIMSPSVAKVIVVMAVEFLKLDLHKERNPTTGLLRNLLNTHGVSLSDDAIQEILKEARENWRKSR